MVIKLELPPETEAQLIAQAAARGISVEELLKAAVDIWLEANLSSETARSFYQTATTTEWLNAFTAWAKNHSNNAPPPSDEAINRESIYREREDRQLSSTAELSPQERAEKFVQWAEKYAVKAPPLPDEAISRESIYREREDRQR